MAGFAFFSLILAPVIEGGMVLTKELRADFTSARLPDLYLPETIPVNVVVMVRDYPLTVFYRKLTYISSVLWMSFFRLRMSSLMDHLHPLQVRPYKRQSVFGVSYHHF